LKIPYLLVIALTAVFVGSMLIVFPFSASIITNSNSHGSQAHQAEAAALPMFVVEKFPDKEFAGDASNSQSKLKVNDEFIDPEHHCEFCTRVEYNPGNLGEAGFAYKSTNPIDFTGAKKVHLWIMGQDGGEKVQFFVAGKRIDNTTQSNNTINSPTKNLFKNEKFGVTTDQLTVDKDWKRIDIDLKGTDLKGITHPFGLEIFKGSGHNQVVYVKGLTYDTQPPENPIGTIQ
jgi:hypothetical protein